MWFIGPECSIWGPTRSVLTARVAVHPNETETPLLHIREGWRLAEQTGLGDGRGLEVAIAMSQSLSETSKKQCEKQRLSIKHKKVERAERLI